MESTSISMEILFEKMKEHFSNIFDEKLEEINLNVNDKCQEINKNINSFRTYVGTELSKVKNQIKEVEAHLQASDVCSSDHIYKPLT